LAAEAQQAAFWSEALAPSEAEARRHSAGVGRGEAMLASSEVFLMGADNSSSGGSGSGGCDGRSGEEEEAIIHC